ncbi:MAG: P-II family nitrogen regulator [Acidobacteria bacterium]|nr:P-II family nitrogen regulator [Acidobacteriota bacterium]
MKLIIAYIQPHALTRVEHALLLLPFFPGMSVSQVRGFGQGKRRDRQTAREELTEFTGKVRIEIGALDEQADAIVNAIASAAHSGRRGDGKIFSIELAGAVRIRTGDRDAEAIRSPGSDEPV